MTAFMMRSTILGYWLVPAVRHISDVNIILIASSILSSEWVGEVKENSYKPAGMKLWKWLQPRSTV